MPPLFLNGLARLFSGIEVAFTGKSRRAFGNVALTVPPEPGSSASRDGLQLCNRGRLQPVPTRGTAAELGSALAYFLSGLVFLLIADILARLICRSDTAGPWGN